MKLALFDDYRLGVVQDGEIVDVTAAVPGHDSDFGASFWLRLCRDFTALRSRLSEAATTGPRKSLDAVRLRAPALNPTKVIATASNYREHVAEMRKPGVPDWLYEFDVFLKAPSAIIGPSDRLLLPTNVGNAEIHHESELVVIIGATARDVSSSDAYRHILGYTIGLDITVRGDGDRSRRKSHDGFAPLGPWITTADEISDPNNLPVRLWVDGKIRQDTRTSEMIKNVGEIIAYASGIMTLNPGDVIFTGAPSGVGKIVPGETIEVEIEGIGRMRTEVGAR